MFRRICWCVGAERVTLIKTKAQYSKSTMMRTKNLVANGFTAPGFEKVKETFNANLKSGLERGGSFAVCYKGELVVNLWGGYSDYSCRRLWKEDTLSTFYSTTKALAALVIAHLVDRGLLDYGAPVCKYWPEFAQNGKETVSLEQLVTNQAGLISLDEPFWLAEIRDDPVKLGQKLAAQPPFWTPGEKHGYHPLTFGLYLDQIVRHVDPKGRSLSEYFDQEIATQFGLEIYIGLPKALFHRSTRVVMGKEFDQEEMLSKFKGELELLLKTRDNPRDFKSVLMVNNPDHRELPVPSTHGHATAANMAKLFGIVANGGQQDGKVFLSEKAIHRFTEPIVAGIDCSFGQDAAWSLGTHLITMVTETREPNHIFGHGGYGGQYAAADVRNHVSFAYTTSFLDPLSSYSDNGDARLYTLIHAMYDSVFKLENFTEKWQLLPFYSQFKAYIDNKDGKQATSKL